MIAMPVLSSVLTSYRSVMSSQRLIVCNRLSEAVWSSLVVRRGSTVKMLVLRAANTFDYFLALRFGSLARECDCEKLNCRAIGRKFGLSFFGRKSHTLTHFSSVTVIQRGVKSPALLRLCGNGLIPNFRCRTAVDPPTITTTITIIIIFNAILTLFSTSTE